MKIFTSLSGRFGTNGSRYAWAGGLALLLIGGATVTLVNRGGDAKASETVKAEAKPPTLEFSEADIAIVRVQALGRTIAIAGSLAPVTQALVKSTVSGEVRSVLVREGDSVAQGAVVAEIDTTDARSRLAAAQAELTERRTRLAIAERNRDTNQSLLKQSFISQNAYEQLNSTFQGSEAAVQGAEAQVALARKAIDDAIVRAPINGKVAKRMVNSGERIAIDAPMFSIVDLSRLELEATVPASDVPRIASGQAVHFRVEGFGDRKFEGRVERINPTAEASSRAIKVFVSVRNTDGSLRGGMFAEGTVTLSGAVNAPVIPAGAVFEEAGQSYVYAVENGLLNKQAVRIGLKDDASGLVEVASGLSAGTPVVRLRMSGLKAGTPAILRGNVAKS